MFTILGKLLVLLIVAVSVTAAALDYRAWYYLEDGWDYGYVSASADGGVTWQILTPPHATTANPVGNAYGTGYTGQSGSWVDESVSLDAYAGKHILLRFEVISDDAITQPGLAIDDLSIPAIGYHSDLEADGGGEPRVIAQGKEFLRCHTEAGKEIERQIELVPPIMERQGPQDPGQAIGQRRGPRQARIADQQQGGHAHQAAAAI